MTQPPTWNLPPAATAEQAALVHEDQLLRALADVRFSTTPAADPSMPSASGTSPGVTDTSDVDPEQATIRAALEAGTIPAFEDEQATAPVAALPIDAAAERAAYVAFLAFVNAHKDPGTVIFTTDPAAFDTAFSQALIRRSP